MARLTRRPAADRHETLVPEHQTCWHCGGPLWATWQRHRTVTTLTGVVALELQVRRCVTPTCPAYHQPYRPEAEGRLALPHQEFGFDVIALVGQLRFAACRSVPEIHQTLLAHGVAIAARTVPHLLARYEELLALTLRDVRTGPVAAPLRTQGAVVLALDGLQPDVGHEVLWVVRDVLSGTVLLARTLLGATVAELVTLLTDVLVGLPPGVAVRGVVSDGQQSIRTAVRTALPGVPHQLCQFHDLREAAQPIFEADRHAKKALKKHLRGVRPIERAVDAAPPDARTEAVRGYGLAVRSALTDDGRPPLAASGVRLHQRVTAITQSLDRVTQRLQRGTERDTAARGKKGDRGLHATPPLDQAAPPRPRHDRRSVAADSAGVRLGASGGAGAGSAPRHAGRPGAAPAPAVAPHDDAPAGHRRPARARGRALLRGDAALQPGTLPLL